MAAIIERPVRAQCRVVVDQTALLRTTGAVCLGPIRCVLDHGHTGTHRHGWWQWSGQYAKDPAHQNGRIGKPYCGRCGQDRRLADGACSQCGNGSKEVTA